MAEAQFALEWGSENTRRCNRFEKIVLAAGPESLSFVHREAHAVAHLSCWLLFLWEMVLSPKNKGWSLIRQSGSFVPGQAS